MHAPLTSFRLRDPLSFCRRPPCPLVDDHFREQLKLFCLKGSYYSVPRIEGWSSGEL
jgi:hypothetical protein